MGCWLVTKTESFIGSTLRFELNNFSLTEFKDNGEILHMWVSLLLGLKFHINSTGNFPARMEKSRALGN